jgi:hypothetical protein
LYLGKDIHFTVLTHAKELLKMCPFIQEKQTLNDLSKIEDSVMLLTILKEMGKLVKLYPHRMTYPDPNSLEAKRPKKVEIPPKEYQNIQGGGMYMFTVKTNAGKQYLWLALMIFAAFFFLLFRVWPEWLRVGVWYVSYYMLVLLVSHTYR